MIVTAPMVASGFAAALQLPLWVAAVLLLPAYAVLTEFIQP
jgi:hypothetical protein